jgi:hypothetical protein
MLRMIVLLVKKKKVVRFAGLVMVLAKYLFLLSLVIFTWRM